MGEGFERAATNLVNEVKKAFVDERTGKNALTLAVEQAKQFLHAIDWTERWLQVLLAVEALLLVVVLLTRRHTTFQGCLFLAPGAVVYCARYLNASCAEHWELFSNQNYFDEAGLFISVVLSGPLLIVNMAIVVNHLIVLSGLVVRAKAAELKAKARKKAKES